ncbi:MAG: hypothetical protein POELPBGB_03266 [Bacteroidia bacterium]|nr:hypothetical protein [Bacteroidia bacterium]
MFQKLTAEEFDQLRIKGWGRSSPTYHAIIGLHLGEAIMIPKSGWKRNKPPSSICRSIEKKFASMKVKYKCVALADDSGWAIKRIA